MDEVDDVEHRLADHEEEAVIDGFVKVGGDGFQVFLDFWADVDLAGKAGAATGGDFARINAGGTDYVVAAGMGQRRKVLFFTLRRHDGTEEVVLDHRYPTGFCVKFF